MKNDLDAKRKNPEGMSAPVSLEYTGDGELEEGKFQELCRR